jgi:hypothetical protein
MSARSGRKHLTDEICRSEPRASQGRRRAVPARGGGGQAQRRPCGPGRRQGEVVESATEVANEPVGGVPTLRWPPSDKARGLVTDQAPLVEVGRLELHFGRLVHPRSGGCRSSDLRFLRTPADRWYPLLSVVSRSAADPARTRVRGLAGSPRPWSSAIGGRAAALAVHRPSGPGV